MASAYWYRGSSHALVMVFGIALLASGCCGPMACGPMGYGPCSSGPLMAFGGGCDGCGETYIDEWINHPPSCDSCDSCGNHSGQSCGSCRPIFSGLKSLWGYRRDCGCDSGCSSGCDSSCDGGCQSCGGGQHYAGAEMGHHYVDSSHAIPMPHQPSHTPQIVEPRPVVKPYEPQRTKQIFRPRNSVAGETSNHGSF